MPSRSTYCLTWVSLTLDVGYLFVAAPYLGRGMSSHGRPSWPWTWISSSWSSCPRQQPPLLGHGVAPLGHRPSPWVRSSSSWPCFCTVHRRQHKIAFFPHSPQHFLISRILAILTGVCWYLIVVLICISLMSDVEHLFTYHVLSVCLKNVCSEPLSIFNQIFFCYWVIYIFNIFWTLTSFQTYDLKHFLPFSRLPFPFVDGFLCCRLSFTVQSLSHVWLFGTPWTAVHQVSLSITISQSWLKLISIESVMPSNHFVLCRPLFLLSSIFPRVRVFSNKLVHCIRWSFSFSISPSNEYSGMISFRIDWFDCFSVQGILKSLLQLHSSKASVLWCSAFLWSNSHIHTWLLEKP